MQNTVTELSHRLLRSLDNNYNVIDMPAVVEIISALERTSITEELLKTTRLGKYINELRRKTPNEILAKRAKELLKKWRDQVLPSSQSTNIHTTSSMIAANGTTNIPTNKQQQNIVATFNNDRSNSPDLNLNRTIINHKKRPLSSLAIEDSNGRKRIKMNGSRHHGSSLSSEHIYISDNSNSSPNVKKIQNSFINSDSNSSFSDLRVPPVSDANLTFSGRNLGGTSSGNIDPSSLQHRTPTTPNQTLTPQQPPPITPLIKPEPKKRGRKKGSKNHKTLLVQAEESFTNKMAVSVNSKVKTTQELLASIQNKTNLVRQPQSQEKMISPKVNNIDGVSSPKITLEGLVKNDKKITAIMDPIQQRTASPKMMENKLLSKVNKERSDSPVKIDLDSENSRSSYQDSVVCITREGSSEDGESEIIEVKEDDEDVDIKQIDIKKSPIVVETAEEISGADETVEDILSKLPKVDYNVLYETENENDVEPSCTCVQPEPIVENITIEFHEPGNTTAGVGSIFDVPDEVNSERTTIVNEISVPHHQTKNDHESIDDDSSLSCPARRYLEQKYRLGNEHITDERVQQFHTCFLDSINGNKCEKTVNQRNCDVNSEDVTTSGLYSNIVPNFHNGEIIKKDITLESINYLKLKKILPYPCLFCVDNNRTTKCCDVLDHDGSGNDDTNHRHHQTSPYHDDEQISSNLDDNDATTTTSEQQQHPANKDEKQVDNDNELSHDNFREFHECVSLRSYNDELLHILPYVVLD